MNNSNFPVVTIVLPTYNRRKFLPAALRSIHEQTFSSWRLLVVNDGGEDVSDVVAAFGDSRMEWHDRPHLGKAAALNHGLSLVQSPYVAYMDDDDLLYPDHLSELVAAAEREHAEFVYSDTWAIWLDPSGKELFRAIENDADVTFEDIRLFNRINHKQILHTKRLADEIGPYNERLRILIDYDFIRRLAKQVRPFHVRKVTGEHFLRQASDRADDFASISGLWISDPEACGRSVAAIFENDPAAIATLWRDAASLSGTRAELDQVRAELGQVRTELGTVRAELAKTQATLGQSRVALERTERALQGSRTRTETIEASLSYRVGRLFTAPFRIVVETAAKLRGAKIR